MTVKLTVSGGIAFATYGDGEELFIGEVSGSWLENEAEQHFIDLFGENVKFEVEVLG